MRLRDYTARELRNRPGRTILTLMGIVIGVGAVVSISITIDATRGTYRHMFDELTGRASLEVVAEGLSGFESDLVDRLAAIPGVRAAVPVVQAQAAIRGQSGSVPVTVLGIDQTVDREARDLTAREGQVPGHDADGVALESSFAAAHGLALGEEAILLTSTGPVALPVVGLLTAAGAAAVNSGAVVFMPLTTAQKCFGLGSRINAIQIVQNAASPTGAIEQRIRQSLPVGLTVQAPAARGALGQEILLATERGFAVMSVVSLVVGGFVILNAFLMSLGERVRHLAIIRAVGATRTQIMRILLSEAAMLGVLGTVAGIALGIAMSSLLKEIMEQMLDLPLPELRVNVTTLFLAALLGPGVAIAAALFPAARSSRRPVLDGLLDHRETREPMYRRWTGYIGIGILAASIGFIALFLAGHLPQSTALKLLPMMMASLIVGGVLTIPLANPALLALVGAGLGRLLGAEGRIAVRQLVRRPTRTGLTVAVLAVSLIVAVGFGNSLLNNVRDIREWVSRISAFDYFVRRFMPDPAMASVAALPESLADDVAGIDGVETVEKINFISGRAEGMPVMMISRTFHERNGLAIDLIEGEPEAVHAAVRRGEIILGSRFSQRSNRSIGDTVTLEGRHGPQAFRVAGIATEYTAGGQVVYLEWHNAQRLLGTEGVHVLGVTARPGDAPEIRTRLEALCEMNGCRVQSREQFRRAVDETMGGVIGAVWVLLILAFVVASLGVVNTLTMNVLEQTREIGVLRAIAMKRRQVGKMVLAQALALGGASLVPGVVGGVIYAYLMDVSTYPLTGVRPDFKLELPLIAASAVGALLIAIAAAALPARRATRLPVIKALQYE